MSYPIGQPLMGFPVTGDANTYLSLACGDNIAVYVMTGVNPPSDAACPIHGKQNVTENSAAPVIIDDTSVARSC
jgi:hypothetical protein